MRLSFRSCKCILRHKIFSEGIFLFVNMLLIPQIWFVEVKRQFMVAVVGYLLYNPIPLKNRVVQLQNFCDLQFIRWRYTQLDLKICFPQQFGLSKKQCWEFYHRVFEQIALFYDQKSEIAVISFQRANCSLRSSLKSNRSDSLTVALF